MSVGTVKFFNEDKGFGFITPENGGDDVFVHLSKLKDNDIETLTKGDRVSYSVSEHNGRIQADIIKLLPRVSYIPPSTSESPLVAQARARTRSATDPNTLEAWQEVVKFLKTGKDRRIYFQESYGGSWGSRQPAFDGDWGKLSAWCKLVGFKLQWNDPKAGHGSGGAWTWTWELYVESSGLPGDKLRDKLLDEFGSPPGY